MKYIKYMAFAICLMFASNSNAFDHSNYAKVLAEFNHDGMVDYKGLIAKSIDLLTYIEQTQQVGLQEFKSWPESEQIAFLINLYNAATLQLIIKNYPVDSIRDIGLGGVFSFISGPWSKDFIQLFGEIVSLNYIEQKLLRKWYQEPRIHFTLVCASHGCPTLRSTPFTGDGLENELAEATRQFIQNPEKTNVDQETNIVNLSLIVRWYNEDFEFGIRNGISDRPSTSEQHVISYLLPYFRLADQQYLLSASYRVKYLDYDWSLNEYGN